MSGNDVKLCYSFSARVDKLGFIDLLHSLHTAKRYFSKEDIIVFFTPPFNDDYEQRIARYATVIRKEHYPIPHPTYDPNDPTPPFYWDKFYFTEVDCDNLIFMDNDTELQRDIRAYFNPQKLAVRKEELLKTVGPNELKERLQRVDVNFDILVFGDDGRNDKAFTDTWNATWEYLKAPTAPLVMTTVILFRKRTHTKLKEEIARIATEYMVTKTIQMPAEDRLYDEYVFALATREYNVQVMLRHTDMVWTAIAGPIDIRPRATILHGGGRRFMRVGNVPTAHETFDNDLLELIKTVYGVTKSVPLRHWIERVAATFIAMLEDDYPNFNIHFGLEGNTIVMHTTAQLSQEVVDKVYNYVWAEKPEQFGFIVRGDLT